MHDAVIIIVKIDSSTDYYKKIRQLIIPSSKKFFMS